MGREDGGGEEENEGDRMGFCRVGMTGGTAVDNELEKVGRITSWY